MQTICNQTFEDFYQIIKNSFRYKCKCSHSVCILKEELDYIVCNHCGSRIYSKKGTFKKNLIERLKNDNI